MPITSASTFADVKAEYLANASYEEDSSVAKARAFVTACRAMILLLPSQVGTGRALSQYRPDLIEAQISQASAFIKANDTANSPPTQFSLTHFRD